MQSYGIIGITLWRICGVSTGKRQYPYVETVVSCLRNSRFLPQKLSFPTVETVISNAGNDSSPPGNGKLMYTINFCTHGELVYVRFILCCRYFICNLSVAGICHVPTIYQLAHYTRLVAGGRCFYVFSTLQRKDYASKLGSQP